MKTISVVGCGKAGKTLCRLWVSRGIVQLRSVLTRSLRSAERAVAFIGAGRAVQDISELEPADLVMIATGDGAIGPCCRAVAQTGLIDADTVVFHLSGALSSAVLQPAARVGAAVGSVHPIHSFADPRSAVETFPGSYCAVEGDQRAYPSLEELFRPLGAVLFPIRPEQKTIYHAGTVFACNYLVALVEVALRCFDRAGVDRQTATKLIEPIVRGTVDNVFRLGPAGALTGPVARGDLLVIVEHLEALGQWNEQLGRLYRELGCVAAQLAEDQSTCPPEAMAAVRPLLARAAPNLRKATV
ncbi:MAG TPA: DUF2520 domain-containing protein [Planctomycetaceae bacterium]|nr:DUF2520 domain-containing protein [Planctomycetaceae bacterium]